MVIVETLLSAPFSPNCSVPIWMPFTFKSVMKLLLGTSTASTALLIALPLAKMLTLSAL